MADYTQTPSQPNIKPTGLPPSDRQSFTPAPKGWGLSPALGAVAVVGIVALVAWGVINNDAATDNPGQTTPSTSQMSPEPAPAATPDAAVTPDVAATPEPMVQPEVTPQEVPAPAPAPAPAPSN